MKDKLIEKYITTALINNLCIEDLNDFYTKITGDDEYVIDENGQETTAIINAYDTGKLTPEVIEEMEKEFFHYQNSLQEDFESTSLNNEDFFFEVGEDFGEYNGDPYDYEAMANFDIEKEKHIFSKRKEATLGNLKIFQIIDAIYAYTTELLSHLNFKEVVTNVIKIEKSNNPKFPDYPTLPYGKIEKILRKSLFDSPHDHLQFLTHNELDTLVMAMNSSKIDSILSNICTNYDNYLLVLICLESLYDNFLKRDVVL